MVVWWYGGMLLAPGLGSHRSFNFPRRGCEAGCCTKNRASNTSFRGTGPFVSMAEPPQEITKSHTPPRFAIPRVQCCRGYRSVDSAMGIWLVRWFGGSIKVKKTDKCTDTFSWCNPPPKMVRGGKVNIPSLHPDPLVENGVRILHRWLRAATSSASSECSECDGT